MKRTDCGKAPHNLLLVLVLATGCSSDPPGANPDGEGVAGPPTGAPAAADARPAPAPDMAPPADRDRAPDARAASDLRPDIAPGPPPDAGPVDAAPAPNPPSPSACANLPSGPIATKEIPGIEPAEDITFDDSGNLYWAQEDGGMVKTTADGSSMLFVPQVEIFGGMRWTPSGDLYIATEEGLEKVLPNGARTVVLRAEDFNGIEVDRQGRVYVSEFGGTRIFRYNPQGNYSEQISKDVIEVPNGLTFNPAFDMLYVSNWGGHNPPALHRIPIQPDGTPGKTEVWVTGVGTGVFDGMAADECGNIYVANTGMGTTGESCVSAPTARPTPSWSNGQARRCTI